MLDNDDLDAISDFKISTKLEFVTNDAEVIHNEVNRFVALQVSLNVSVDLID